MDQPRMISIGKGLYQDHPMGVQWTTVPHTTFRLALGTPLMVQVEVS